MEEIVIIALKDKFASHALPELAGSQPHPVTSLRRVLSALEQGGWGGQMAQRPESLCARVSAALAKPEGQVAVLEVTDSAAFGRSVQDMLPSFIYDRIDLPRPMARLIPQLDC